jgi:hypothetical protein
MSFLTPLYLAGLAAIALPLVFHLIRRTPRGQTPFSSLMFLTPSPPRITRRSRLDQLLLLLLRAAALTLLAIAFARPFFREALQLGLDAQRGQRVAILVDASASMRRADLWRQAQERAAAVLKGLKATDRVALFTFDDGVRTLIDFDDPTEVDPRRLAALIQQRLAEVSPTWAAADLGHALTVAADRLDALDQGQKTESDIGRRIVLVSDMKQGARLDALQAYEWPATIELELQPVAPKNTANAGLHAAGRGWEEENAFATKPDGQAKPEGEPTPIVQEAQRVRVSNAADSTAEQFQLVWRDEQDRSLGPSAKVYVPPGQSRIVSAPRPQSTQPLRLVLQGDAHDFDNTLYVAPQARQELTVAYLGGDAADDPQGCRYYLERALLESPQRSIRLAAPRPDEPLSLPDEAPPSLVVVAGNLEESRLAELRNYLERGGRALYVTVEAPAPGLANLLGDSELTVEEADAGDYALLGAIDFGHALFAPFADPRYSDFTKIHFWKHRRLSFSDAKDAHAPPPPERKIVASFDNGHPALVEQPVGRGRLYVVATSWRPVDSQLARSSKFVPLIWSLLGTSLDEAAAATYVHQPLPLPPAAAQTPVVRKPDGATAALPADADAFRETDAPGVYTIGDQKFIVQLDPSESNTSPRPAEEFEQYGVRLTGAQQRSAEAERQRHLRDVELESRQKVWQWLLAAALVVLIGETWLAGRYSRALASTQ